MDQTIPQYYANKKIFLTGATGFLGKVFVEKVLRSCPEVDTIYCLVRPKKGQSGDDRLQKLLQDQLYNRLRAEQPNFTDKVKAIHGDLLDEDLGIKPSDKEFLEANMQIVFHSAATIRFDEHLRLAVQMNLQGVRKMVKLCKTFQKLEVFVHVSTAYANCDRQYIEEIVYPPPVDPQKVIDAIECLDDDMITDVTARLIGNKPNTYTYTKQLAETLLIQEGGDLPLAIIRPSIVSAAWQEPYPGWIDNYNGFSGTLVGIGKGVIRCTKIDSQKVADIIPVDFAVNLMIAVGWYTAVKKPAQNAKIYHITSGCLNPLTWGELSRLLQKVHRGYNTPARSMFTLCK